MLISPLRNFSSSLDIPELSGITSDRQVSIFFFNKEVKHIVGFQSCFYHMRYDCLTSANASSNRQTELLYQELQQEMRNFERSCHVPVVFFMSALSSLHFKLLQIQWHDSNKIQYCHSRLYKVYNVSMIV